MTELPDHAMILAEDERVAFVQALQAIRNRVRWKPGKDIIHLKKRQRMEHLPVSATLDDYEQIIYDIVTNECRIGDVVP